MDKRHNKTVQNKKNEEKFFVKITTGEREQVANWLEQNKLEEIQDEKFIVLIEKALEKVKYDYWIASLEPSVEDGKIYYQEGAEVATNIIASEWKKMCQEYAPERDSRMANLYELFIWYTWRVVKGYWTYKDFMKESTQMGNYKSATIKYSIKDLRRYRHVLELAGARECGGYKDGQGNTCKLVMDEGKYVAVGGCYRVSGKQYPIGRISSYYGAFKLHTYCHGVTVLTK